MSAWSRPSKADESPAERPPRSFYQQHEAADPRRHRGAGGDRHLAGALVEREDLAAVLHRPVGGRQALRAKTGPQGRLKQDMAYSGTNFVIGVGLAIAAGVVLGVVIGWYRRLAMVFEPFLNALYATPRVALVPLILIWFGIGMWSKVFIVFINAFFPVLINTIGGVRAIDARPAARRARVLRVGLADLHDGGDSRVRCRSSSPACVRPSRSD